MKLLIALIVTKNGKKRKSLANHSRIHLRCLQCGNKFKTKETKKSHFCSKTYTLVQEFANTSCLPHPEPAKYCTVTVHNQLRHHLNVNFVDVSISFKNFKEKELSLETIYEQLEHVFENVLYVLLKHTKPTDLFKFILQTSDIQR